MIAITGASGQIGRQVIQQLLKRTSAANLLAIARNPADIDEFRRAGVCVRQADYNQAETLLPALSGARKILLISGNELGRRESQHAAVISAAKQLKVDLLAYTSVTKASHSPIGLAQEHKVTEQLIHQCGLPAVILRNCWYNENLTQNLSGVLTAGKVRGAASDGIIHTAAAADYAEAAAIILHSDEKHRGNIYEFAGDQGFTMKQYAAEISRLCGKKIHYENLPERDFSEYLTRLRMPAVQARLLADAQIHAANGWLQESSQTLSKILGRPTTSMAEAITAAL